MQTLSCYRRIFAQSLMLALSFGASLVAQPLAEPHRCIYPEQRNFDIRQPDQYGPSPLEPIGSIRTVTDPDYRETREVSLDEAIRLALSNADVIRILTGTTANSSGQTIYDPAITNTQVDQARSIFDPNLNLQNTYQRNQTPQGVPDATAPSGAAIRGTTIDNYGMGLSLSQQKSSGGTASLGVTTNPTRVASPGLTLNPQTPTSVEFGLSQPLLRGFGRNVNLAPIVIARLDTERSFYFLKGTVQEMVRSVVDGYWGLVFARTDIWARRQQIQQLEFAYNYFRDRQRVGLADEGDTAQALVTLANFQANLISARADLLNREAAYLSVIGWPPDYDLRLVPSTPPTAEKLSYSWETLLAYAQEQRPDLIELKIQIEADRQRLLVANNSTLPQLDAVSLYRSNALGGRAPSGDIISSQAFQFGDVQVGLNLSLPVLRRNARAILRQQELSLARDEALLNQRILEAKHRIAQRVRNLESLHAQYEAFKRVRAASQINLDQQFQIFRSGGFTNNRIIVLNVLQAVTAWGNAVSNEALSLTQYNSELAALQLETGTILEEHGILFYEEQFLSKGPGLPNNTPPYPAATPVGENAPRYPQGERPAEESFDLKAPLPDLSKPPAPMPPPPQLPQLESMFDAAPAEDVAPGLPDSPAFPAEPIAPSNGTPPVQPPPTLPPQSIEDRLKELYQPQ